MSSPGRVVNMHDEPKCDIVVSRPSIWGNPFKVGVDGTREQVILRYEEWIRGQPMLMAKVGSLHGKVLGCWCKPKACHGDVLLRLAAERSGRSDASSL